MARSNEITSTEKLLDLIRNKKGDPSPAVQGSSETHTACAPSPGRRSIISLRKALSVGKPSTVGVDIGHEYLRLVKTVQRADGTPDLVDQRRAPIPQTPGRGSAEFAGFIKAELDSFCGPNKKQRIWAIMSAANVDVRHIRIPKVPKKQIENVVLWTVKKESPFDEKDTIFDYEVLGEVVEQGISKLAVMYYTVPRQEIEETKKLFSRSGWQLTGLTVTPFAMQNIFRTRWIPGYEGTAASLFIGNDFSRIDIYANGNLVMTRGIKSGISSMIESLIEGFNEQTAAAGEGEFQIDREKARKILFSLSSDAPPLVEGDTGFGLTEEGIWAMVLPAFERFVRQVERTFEYFTINLGNEKVDKIYVSGAMNVYRRITEYVGEQLNIESDIFDPLNQQLSCRDDDNAFFTSVSERIAFAPALGIALSDNLYTPNFLFTYMDKQRETSVKGINRMVFIAFMVSVSLCTAIFLYQLHAIDIRTATLSRLERQLAQYNPPVDRDLILKSISAAGQDLASAKAYSQKYSGMAIISDLSAQTPPEIRLISLRTKLGGPPDKSKEALTAKPGAAQEKPGAAQAKPDPVPAKPKEEIKEVELEGFVFGDRKTLEVSLANYVMKLDNSHFFSQITIQKKSEETIRKVAVLRFTISMKVG